MLTTCYGFKIQNGLLRLSVKPREYLYVKLNSHTLQALSGLNVRSVTFTPDTLSISYSKETAEIEPEGYIGVDRNLNNVTTAWPNGIAKTFDLSKVDRDQVRIPLCQEPIQEKRLPEKSADLFQVWRESATMYNQYSTTCLRELSRMLKLDGMA